MSDAAGNAGQTLMVGLNGPELEDSERDLLRRLRPAGVILFARNLKSPEKLEELEGIQPGGFVQLPPFFQVGEGDPPIAGVPNPDRQRAEGRHGDHDIKTWSQELHAPTFGRKEDDEDGGFYRSDRR